MEAVKEKPRTKKKKDKKKQIIETTGESSKSHESETMQEDTIDVEIAEDIIEETKEQPIIEPVEQTENGEEALLSFNTILNLNKQIVIEITKENIQEQPKVVKAKVENSIKAYTESQLSTLYTNTELQTLEEFINQYVEAELKGISVKQHTLYDLLMNYLHVREKITGNTLELEQYRKEYKNLQGELWSVFSANVSGRAECQDGTIVTATHTYNKSMFHRSVFQTIIRLLGNIQKLTYENHVLYSYSAEDLKLQIELYIQTVVSNLINVKQLDKNAPVSFTLESEPLHLKQFLSEVRLCISVLFAFQRKLIRDKKFIKETRSWLSRLIAVLLRVANFQDHLFIINHVLRCPAGVGSWAASFVQAPLNFSNDSPFSNSEINHLVTILAVILMPVKERHKFLEDIAQPKETATEALWVMVDSDGEEDEEASGTSLRENDLVSLLNQLPWDNLFRALLLIKNRNFKDEYDISQVTEYHILRFFAFSTSLLRIFHSGLQTYDQPRYNQFSKRLSRFIRHVVQFATDQWEEFQKYQATEDPAMCQRLQVEYDAFFLRAIYYLYSSQKLGAWQFLAVVPYHVVTTKTLWKIFYFLHNSDNFAKDILNPVDDNDYSTMLWDKDLRNQFEEKLSNLADAESYYLLNTFANMALARTNGDMDFIHAATLDLLHIGFISEATQDTCSKSAKILLTHITSKHPHLLSNILKTVKDNMEKIGDLALNLYEELPLTVWNVLEDDFQIISKLLLKNGIATNETKLARMILSRLNWDKIPYEMHCEIAILVVQAADAEPGYLQWAWQTILRLKLHINDKAFTEFGRVQELEKYGILIKGIREQKPLASFVTVLMTTWGHSVPLICTKGLSQLLFLQTHQKHEAVLFALYVIMPLFIESQECIINCEKFQDILLNLLNADRGYISMAKSLISMQNTTVLQQFGNMIETQIVNYPYYDLESPRCLVRLWMNSLVSIPKWNKDFGVMYLLDVIIRTAFFHTDALDVAYNILRELIQCTTPQEQSGTISSLFKWVSSTNTNGSLISSSLATYPYLGYIMIEIEHVEREAKTGIWKELLMQLNNQKGKVNVDQAIKKAASNQKVASFSSGWLCIYRWSQQAIDTPLDHPLLPLLWQKFFTLFLARLPGSSFLDRGCVGEKFFDGLVNFAFLKKIKKRLQETVEYYQRLLDVKDEDNKELEKKQFRQSLLKIFQAFLLWLEESRLQENNINLHSLPPQYESTLLGHIINGSYTPWYEYLDYDKMKDEQCHAIMLWRIANFREKNNVNQPLLAPGKTMESSNPVERMLRRLTSYDTPLSPPQITNSAPIIAPLNFSNKEEMFKSLKTSFDTLQQFSHNHMLKISEHKALDCFYQELVPQLYRSVLNKVKKKVPCTGRNQAVHCTGAAVIILEMEEARINERIEHQIQSNRNAYESVLAKSLQDPAINLCTASITLQQAIRILQVQLKCNPATAELGVELFYLILSLLTEEIVNYPPTRTLFSTCLEKLGQSHICEVEIEMPRLLDKILKEPQLGGYLAPHFSPSNVGTTNLLFMYSTICKEIGQKYDITFALLSKFEVENWLKNRQPKLSQRSQFIQSVIKALTTIGFDPPVQSLMLHGLYRKHLLTVFEFQFPEHYGEVVVNLLKASNANTDTSLLSVSVWLDILNSLAKPVQLSLNVGVREQLRQYAQHQKMLQHQELLETASLLAKHFTQERLQYGLYGLYPKCRNYMDVFVLYMGMTGHGLVVSTLNVHQGLLDDQLCEKIWPLLRDMFAPWLIPYSMKENMASWIQQLADDRSVLLPWIPADESYAQKVIHVFFECIQFIIITLPACNNILSFVWQWYVGSFAHTSVKDHILHPIHQVFMGLQWHNFWPSVNDLELMLRTIDQYLPTSHTFLGHIFISISWPNWLNNFSTSPPQVKSRVYQCYLNLLVKLSNEPNVRNRCQEKAKSLMVQSESFDWSVIDATVYQYVMDWYVMSCDSNVIFRKDPLNLDYRVLHLLKVVSGYTTKTVTVTPDIQNKRLIFLRTFIKLISVFTSKYKASLSSKEQELQTVLSSELVELENIAKSHEECSALFAEILYMLNIRSLSTVTSRVFGDWLARRPGDGAVICAALKNAGMVVNDLDALATILEVVLDSYFQNNVTEPSWKYISENLAILASKQTELEHILVNKGCVLSLYAILVQKIGKLADTEALLNCCLNWLVHIKISTSTEPKLPLIWNAIIHLSLLHCKTDEPSTAAMLCKFSQILLELAEDRSSSGWGRGLLTAIGIRSQAVSIQFRFLCKAIAGYILAQIPDMKGSPQVIRQVENAPLKVGQPGGNMDCVKILLSMDFGQSQGQIKDAAEMALKQIQDPANSMHNAKNFLFLMVKQFFLKPYLRDIG